jgi:Outer membrane lipoprotein-sorting protein
VRRAVAIALVGLAALAAPARAAEDADAGSAFPSAREMIERAFQNFYYCDVRANLTFDVRRKGEPVLHYDTEFLRKFIGGRAHDLFYFQGEGDMRGLRVLRIERGDRADDAFVWLPALHRVRRVAMAQRGDKMLGMEVTLEDLEVQRLEKLEIVGSAFSRVEGEPVRVVTMKRLEGGMYDRADFFIATTDYAILEVRFYRPGAVEPYKVTYMRRADMQQYPGHVLPSRIEFHDRVLDTETTMVFDRRQVNPDLPTDRFTVLSLEKRKRLSLVQNVAAEDADRQEARR